LERLERLASGCVRVAIAVPLLTLFFAPPVRSASAPTKPPAAAKHPVENHYFSTTVRDDYEWMENWSDPALRSWVAAQNAYTRSVLDKLPSRTAIRDRVAELSRDIAPDYFALQYKGSFLFALKDEPPKNQPMLVVRGSADSDSREVVLVDPNKIDSTGSTTIDFYVPSSDGKRVAVSLSKGGTESGDVHLYDVATGHELPDVLPRVNGGTAGGSVAWTAGGSGLLYTRYPAPGERPAEDLDFYQQAWFHLLGTPSSEDTCVLGKELPKIAEIEFRNAPPGLVAEAYVLILVRNGDGGEIG